MDPLAEFTKLEAWDDEGKPFLQEYKGVGKLEGKKIIVTGGDSGIGRSAAQMFAREGADLTIVYLPEEEEE
jgi:NADPH:quinone reductase-like Zn-dependent oxidoreductase